MDMEIIGRNDIVDLPSFCLMDVPVKIDTGAYSCSIDCSSIELSLQGDQEVLEVVFLNKEYPKFSGGKIVFSDFTVKSVKSSTGEAQNRYFIKGEIILFGETYYTDFSLSCRKGMRNPVLLGRKLLNKNFVVDTSKTKLSFKSKTRKD
jgi:hypothetical protein